MMEVPVVEEFLAGSGEPGGIVATDQAWEGFLPMDRQPLEFLQQFTVYERL
jgi:hypothetical protein